MQDLSILDVMEFCSLRLRYVHYTFLKRKNIQGHLIRFVRVT